MIIKGLHSLTDDQSYNQIKSRWTGVWRNIAKRKVALEKINIPLDEVMQSGESREGLVSPYIVDGDFCVAALWERIERATFPISDSVFPWLKTIPLKVLGFVWRAKQNKIPSARALRDRGGEMTSTLCGFYRRSEETGDHILVECPLAKDVLVSILH